MLDEYIEIEVQDRGMNTEEIPEAELTELINNNKELTDEALITNIDHNLIEDVILEDNTDKYNKILSELNQELQDKTNQVEQYEKINNELKSKIEISNKKYSEIINKLKEKEDNNIEETLSKKIKEAEKEIEAYNAETERLKKEIDSLKNKLEFKSNLDKAFNLQNMMKQEQIKNNELKTQIEALSRVNNTQRKYINNYDQENQITKKLGYLKSEIKITKDTIKEYQEKYNKQDKFIKLAHEKILSLEMMLRKKKEKPAEKKKLFSQAELNNLIDNIKSLIQQIKDNRNTLNNLTKINDDKISQIKSQNDNIEKCYKENEKLNKNLVYKKNELKRSIKNKP